MVAGYQHDVYSDVAGTPSHISLSEMEARLERGLAIIEERRMAGQPVARLEDYWIDLLRSYEALFDRSHSPPSH